MVSMRISLIYLTSYVRVLNGFGITDDVEQLRSAQTRSNTFRSIEWRRDQFGFSANRGYFIDDDDDTVDEDGADGE